MNFLCILLFFRRICGRHFLEHNNAKQINFSHWEKKKNCIDFVHKITFGAIFGPTCMYKKLRNFGTVKIVIKCRGESFARCWVIARNVEGGGPSCPQSFYGLRKWNIVIGKLINFHITGICESVMSSPLFIAFSVTLNIRYFLSWSLNIMWIFSHHVQFMY